MTVKGSLSIDAIDAPRRLVLTPREGAPEAVDVDAPENPMVGEVERFRDAVRGADITVDQDRTARTLGLVDSLMAHEPR